MPLDYLRDRVLPAYHEVPEVDDPMALLFVVNDPKQDAGSEDDVLHAAINAMLALFASEDAAVRASIEAWLAGRIRKIVKRARNKAWDDLRDLPEYVAEAQVNQAQVRVFRPMHISQFPDALRKLQVSGLQRDVAPVASPATSTLEIFIDTSLNMSTGKLVAQVAHAAQLFYMYAPAAEVDAWITATSPVRFTRLPDFAQLPSVEIAVHDAGFTEVAANSNTTAARYLS